MTTTTETEPPKHANTIVEVYMHGTRQGPRTAYSLLACRLLALFGVEFTDHDIGSDDRARQRATAVSGVDIWPQVFIAGEFVGGGEVLAELLRTGRIQPVTSSAVPR